MAKYTESVFGTISGEALGVVASTNKAGRYIKKKTVGADAKTQKQLSRRAIYAEFCSLWRDTRKVVVDGVPRKIMTKGEMFKACLSACLEKTETAAALKLFCLPKSFTMAAPIIDIQGVLYRNDGGGRATLRWFFPVYDDLSRFGLCGSTAGIVPVASLWNVPRFEYYAATPQTAETTVFAANIPKRNSALLPGAESSRLFFIYDKKTGGISKPANIVFLDSGDISVEYPFGR